MKIGKLYSCKWTPFHSSKERGWDLLILIDIHTDLQNRYVFYDLIHGARRHLSEGLTKHCKEITTEEQCTQ